MTPPTEAPEKAKAAPRRDYYNPNVCFALIFAAFAAMLCFRTNELFGAVRLGAFYADAALVVVFVTAIPLLVLLRRWRIFDARKTTVFIILFIPALVISRAMGWFILAGWFVGVLNWFIAPIAPLAGILFTLLIWIIVSGFRLVTIPPLWLKRVTLLFLIGTPLYLVGIGSSPPNFERDFVDIEQMSEHDYTLILHWGWLGDPDWIELFECNQFAMACKQIYESPPRQYRYPERKDIRLISDMAAGTISIVVDGEVLYTHQPQ